MGFLIRLEFENGKILKTLDDPSNIFGHLLSSSGSASFELLKYLDPYGDTVFNRLQMRTLDEEIRSLLRETTNSEQSLFVKKLLELVSEATREPHLYIKFYGD